MSQTIFITGCSSDIGRAIALHFAGKGWNVVATMRDPVDAADLAGLITVQVLPLDITDPFAIKAAPASAAERSGKIDALVNNAGFAVWARWRRSLPTASSANSPSMFWV